MEEEFEKLSKRINEIEKRINEIEKIQSRSTEKFDRLFDTISEIKADIHDISLKLEENAEKPREMIYKITTGTSIAIITAVITYLAKSGG